MVDINSCLSDHNNTLEAEHLVTTEKQVSQDIAGVSSINGNTDTKSQEHPENTLLNENNQSNISNLQTTSVTTQANLVNTENTENSTNTTKTREQISKKASRDSINTKNRPPTESSLESSDNANQNNTENHIHAENNGDKTDWEKLMINSDDSLFEEMTKQLEKDHSSDKSDVTETTIPKINRDPTESEGKLPDLIHYSQDAVTRLLLLGASVNCSSKCTQVTRLHQRHAKN